MRTLLPFLAFALLGCFRSSSIDGDAGSGSDAGLESDAGVGDAGSDAGVACDDSDPCTRDVVVDGRCAHEPVSGVRCDDGDACTVDDVCEVGVCAGVAAAGELLSVLEPRYRGPGRAVGDDRYLFLTPGDPSTLRLVRVVGGRFTSLHELEVAERLGDVEWLADDLVSLRANDGARLASLDGDRIRLRGSLPVSARLGEVALAGDRAWACVALDWLSAVLVEFDVSDLDAPVELGEVGTSCVSVVADDPADGAFVARQLGNVQRLTPRPGTTSTLTDLGFEAEALHVGHGYLSATSLDAVRLVRASDGVLVGEVASGDGYLMRSARMTSLGLETWVDAYRDGFVLELVVHDVRPGATPPIVERSRERVADANGALGATRWGSHEQGYRHGDRLFVLDDAAPHAREIVDPERSWPGGLRVEGTEVVLRGNRTTARIDVSDPRAPRVIGGGLHGGAEDVVALDLEDSALHPDRWRGGILDAVEGLPILASPPADLVVRRFDAADRAVDAARHDLGLGGDSTRHDRLHLRGEHLYRTSWARGAARGAVVERWLAADLAGGETPEPWRLEIAPLEGSFSAWAKLHDEDAIAFATELGAESVVYLQPLGGGEPLGTTLALRVNDVAVSEGRVLVMAAEPREDSQTEELHVVVLERRGDALVEVARRVWDVARGAVTQRQILSFDGDVSYLHVASYEEVGSELLAIRVDELHGAVGRWALPLLGVVEGFEETSFGPVLSRGDMLVVAAPWCGE